MLSPSIKIVNEIANLIKEENLRGKDRIPTSEFFIKRCASTFNKTADEIRYYLEQLRETHYIFIFNIVSADPTLFVQAVDGYVFSEISVLNELKHYTESKLTQVYESTFYKKKTGFQILRELYPRTKEYNNTNLGRALNESHMVEEYIKQVSSNAFEFTESWKKEKLYKLYREEEEAAMADSKSGNDAGSMRNDYKNLKEPNSKWARAVRQFSVKFLIRIHFRKYEFDVVKKLILSGKIYDIEDMIYIRNCILDLEKFLDKDPILNYHLEKMTDLRRICQAKINISRKSVFGKN